MDSPSVRIAHWVVELIAQERGVSGAVVYAWMLEAMDRAREAAQDGEDAEAVRFWARLTAHGHAPTIYDFILRIGMDEMAKGRRLFLD